MKIELNPKVKISRLANYLNADAEGLKISHCYANCEVIIDGESVANIVLDKYTPKNGKPGWYFAFRKPGYQKGITPTLYIATKKTNLVDVLADYETDVLSFLRLWSDYGQSYLRLVLSDVNGVIVEDGRYY